MFGKRKLESSTEVLQVITQGPILQISFRGVHKDGFGNEIGDYLRRVLREQDPAGVVLDFRHFEYIFGNDMGTILFGATREGSSRGTGLRPCAIVATSRTAKSLMSLLKLAKGLDVFGLKFFADVDSAVRDVRERVEQSWAHRQNAGDSQ